MNAATTHADFISAVIAGVHRLIPCDYCGIHLLDRQREKIMHRMDPIIPYNEDEVAYYSAHPQENAVVAYYERTGDLSARRRSDVISMRKFLSSDHYRHCLARLDLRYSLALPVTVDRDVVGGIVLDRREKDFTKRDCALLDAFAPHFLLAWNRQKNPWRVSHHKTKPRDGDLLTARESDVLYWITEGKQNREIAMILGISLYTVQKHVANILRKLDVENRHALTVLTLNLAAGK
ncbi:MAG: LuxR C-terminal-related transcriptional regulator [Cephaloticoccus sp.]|nr:LuxR C-terminal-related transcriptional regulator [Cephaloticoccus sp.]MCF7759124.1 LuxR C-terminal-related transcriptional regulator [Cephaloticoccus sp.]